MLDFFSKLDLHNFPWWDFGITSRAVGIVIWIGLAALTIALMVLSRTRWGQAKPLSKCVALSIFAHMLFMCYAYGTHLILEAPTPAERRVIKLTIVNSDDQVSRDADDDRPREPWETSVSPAVIEPAADTPQRMEVEPDINPLERRAISQLKTTPLQDTSPLPQPVRPTATPVDSSKQLQVTETNSNATEIQRPNVAKSQNDTQPVGPQVVGPRRVRLSQPIPVVTKRATSSDSASQLLNDQSRVQKLANIAMNTTNSNAVSDQIDATRQALNQFDGIRQTVSPSPSAIVKAPVSQDPQAESISSSTQSVNASSTPRQTAPSMEIPIGTNNTASRPTPRRKSDGQQLPEIYQNRVSDRAVIAAQHGGDGRTEAAVQAALDWLARHQNPDGRWDASEFGAGRASNILGQDRKSAGAHADTGITGLALLALLAHGQTHLEGEYRKNVQHGLEFLMRSQGDNGNLGGQAQLYAMMYCHGMASLAMSEAYAITGDDRLQPYVQRAINFIVASQHPTSGGWRYRAGDRGDMSQFGWQVMALKSAELGGIKTPEKTRTGMLKFLRSCTSGRYYGLASYRPGEKTSRVMTAEALTCRYFLGQQIDPRLTQEAMTFISQSLPRGGKPNLYYWYYGTLATYHSGGEHWKSWNNALKQRLISTQRTNGTLAGSWDPDTVWGGCGGRVYSTAMGALCLEVYYRYLPLVANPSTGVK